MRLRTFAFIIASLMAATSASGQDLFIGARVGTDWSSSTQTPALTGVNYASHLGFVGGLQVDGWFDDMWAISVQALYDQKGFKITSPITANDVYTYIEIPVLLKVGIGSSAAKFYMEAGPSLGLKLSAKTERNSVVDINSTLTSSDLSLFVGGGIQYRLSPDVFFVTDIGYAFGLSDINSDHTIVPHVTNTLSNIRFGLGVIFPLF